MAKGKWGGARPNSGPKKNRDKYPEVFESAAALLKANAIAMTQAGVDLALGVKVQETDAEGNDRVYKKPPDVRALTEMLNRFFGKVQDEVDVTSDGESIAFANESERLRALVAFAQSIGNGGAGQDTPSPDPEEGS